MFKVTKKEIEWGGSKLSLETGKIARQADGAVLVSYGDTKVLCTVVAEKEAKEGIDFIPLSVHYIEKSFAAGKIPGGFFKREGKPSERETLTSRLIDRPLRPLFPENFFYETQIICTVLSIDKLHYPDIVAMIGSSAALAISGIPFNGPVAGVRVGYSNGEFILNPKHGKELEESNLDLVVAGTEDSVLMVESEANILSENTMLDAIDFAHKNLQPIIKLIKDFASECAKERWEIIAEDNTNIYSEIKKIAEKDIIEAYKITKKQERYEKLNSIRKLITEKLSEQEFDNLLIKKSLKSLEQEIVRGNILNQGIRIDGRNSKEIRQIESEVSILDRTHGSALFTRGETQSFAVATLGSSADEQIMDLLEGEIKQRFMVHYNFPPYSVGEATGLKPPGRREIGHGKLAWRALNAVLPPKAEFPYTIRIVSEITECNGSSSMASVCSGALAMMDAGVPIKSSVAGIAMGLIMEKEKYVILSDIMGDEDHLGDMDFKVAGTEEGITALQMDIKIPGITLEIMKEALQQAKEGRIHILERMKNCISEPREELSKYAPINTTIKVSIDKIRDIIGSGGKVIRSICDTTGAKVEIENDGTVNIFGYDLESAEKATKMINEIISEPEVNQIYESKVVRITDFGAFVNFFGALEGLVHISELGEGHIEKAEDIVSEGDIIKVKLLEIDSRGRFKLSMRVVDQETGEDITGMLKNPPVIDSRPNRKSSYRGNNPSPNGNKKHPQKARSSNVSNSGEDKKEKRKYFN